MLQTESPYFQPTPPPPIPFESVVGGFPGDPDYTCPSERDFSGCDESWGVIIRESADIFIAGAGLYSWFSSYEQACIDAQQCQEALLLLDSNYANVRIQHLITIGAEYMVVMDGKGITAKDNLNIAAHPFWSQISILDVGSNGTQFNEVVWIEPKMWDMEQPAFTCSPPCNVKIPPWTKATSTVDYPLITVSDGTWTSTITKAPLTISLWVFEAVTLTQGGGSEVDNAKLKRQGFDAFMPKPATTPYWPSVTYNGPDGSVTTVGPTVPFPTPPASIGPDAPPPPTGSWPKRNIQPYIGQDTPYVKECDYFDFLCIKDPWIYGANDTSKDDGDGDSFDENWEELKSTCRIKKSSSSTSSTTTTSETPKPKPSPSEGDPTQNKLSCYGSGETTEGDRMRNSATSFCKQLGSTGDILAAESIHKAKLDFDYNGGIGIVEMVLSLEINPGCQWTWDLAECQHYLAVPTDACNCGGVNGKQGGVVRNNCYSWRIDPNRKLS